MTTLWGPGGSAEIAYRQEQVRQQVAAARRVRPARSTSGDHRSLLTHRRAPGHGAPAPAHAGT